MREMINIMCAVIEGHEEVLTRVGAQCVPSVLRSLLHVHHAFDRCLHCSNCMALEWKEIRGCHSGPPNFFVYNQRHQLSIQTARREQKAAKEKEDFLERVATQINAAIK